MTFDLDKLEALAKAATPGEWRVSNHRQSSRAIQTVKNDYEVASVPLNKFTDNTRREADADFIAAANPPTMIALVAHIRELEADNKDFLDQITVQTESVLFKELQAENEALRVKQAGLVALAQKAYHEGFGEGIKEHTTHRSGKGWYESRARAAIIDACDYRKGTPNV